MQEDQYLTISAESRGLYKEKGSKFIGLAFPVDSTEEVRLLLEKVRKQYHDARHHCYAYKIGKDNPEFRFNDDGEPSGTAGRPIFGQIESFGLTNVLVVVVRYFGGVKLGTGGLIQAYRSAARDALGQGSVIMKTILIKISIKFPYSATNEIMKIVKDEGLILINQDFSQEGSLVVNVRKGRFSAVHDRFSGIIGTVIE